MPRSMVGLLAAVAAAMSALAGLTHGDLAAAIILCASSAAGLAAYAALPPSKKFFGVQFSLMPLERT